MFNSLNELQILSSLRIRGVPRKAPSIVSISCHPPPSGWIKANTDGSSLGSPGAAGSGGIFRTARGLPRGAFTFSTGSSFAFLAELQAAIKAIEIAWHRGWHSLWLECDSLYVVHLFRAKSNRVPWTVRQQWLQCLSYVS